MSNYDNLVFVDVEATGVSPFSGVMTEFGAVHFTTRDTFHGRLYDSMPSPDNPAIPVLTGKREYDHTAIMREFADWLAEHVPGRRPVFVSDNPAFDFQWINYYFDAAISANPFGHSGRRIGDFAAGLRGKWGARQDWKMLRRTPHDHNPVHDALGNVEAFAALVGELDGVPEEVRASMRGVLSDEGINRWWSLPNPHLPGGESPHAAWIMGHHAELTDLIDGYLNPSFT